MRYPIGCPSTIFLVLTLAYGSAAPDALMAQTCFRPRPEPRCSSSWITEFGHGFRVGDARQLLLRPGLNFIWEIGHLRNLGDQWALGLTLYYRQVSLSHNDWSPRLGPRLRVRRWLGSGISLDGGAGVLFGAGRAGGQDVRLGAPGLTTHLAVTLGDWVAITSDVEVIRYEVPGSGSRHWPDGTSVQRPAAGTDVAWYWGARFGTYPGLLAGLGWGAFFAVLSNLFGLRWPV